MGEAVVRDAVEADAAAVAGLIRAAFAGLGVVPPPSALGETTESVARTLEGSGEGSGGAVAEAGGEIVGAVLWTERDGALYLGRLVVAEGWRRRGLATALVGAGERAARARGIGRLTLGTRLALTGNRRLFASLGFRETTRHRHAGFTEDTWVTMERDLA